MTTSSFNTGPTQASECPKQISDDWPLGVIPYRALVNVVNVYDLGVYHFMRWKLLRLKKKIRGVAYYERSSVLTTRKRMASPSVSARLRFGIYVGTKIAANDH